jgi:hypothetical protein
VYIHEVVHDPGLDVTLVFVHHNFATSVNNFEIAQFGFQVLVNCLVLLLVLSDTFLKIINFLIFRNIFLPAGSEMGCPALHWGFGSLC